MKASERVTKIADELMLESNHEVCASRQYIGNEVMAISCLSSSRALLTMARILRGTASELKKEEEQGRTERTGEGMNAQLRKIRTAVADYMSSEGCTCCQDVEAHRQHERMLGKLLNVPMYDDKSGYNFSLFRSVPLKQKGHSRHE